MIAWLAAAAVAGTAGTFAAVPATHDPALLELPIADLPAMHDGAYAAPTWDQAIDGTKAQYQATHRAFAAWAERRWGAERRDAIAMTLGLGWELAANLLPLGNVWAHEEGHRAVLDHRGMRSFNGVYDVDPSGGAVYVRGIRDRDLVRLKRDHPADSARLAAAGMETETVVNLRIERDLFFLRGRVATDWATLLANATNNIGYVWACSEPAVADPFTDETNRRDGRVIVRRDALGLDCTAWAYDLQRPGEPYDARGLHPSGRGIDRYVKFSDMTYDEQKLLRTVRWVSLVALADPFLWLEDGWDAGEDTRASTNLAFFLTSFGWTVDHNVFVASGTRNVVVTVHHHVNGARWMPGVDLEVWRVPLAGGMRLTLSLGTWLQPEDQRWETARAVPGGRAGAALAVPLWRALELELGAARKTAGWVAANAALDAETSFQASLAWRLGH